MTGIVQTLIGGFGAAAAAVTDAYFYLTTLLLPGNGTNGAQNNTFLDSSTNNFSITRNPSTGPNAPTQGTFSPFSQTGWSVYFNRAVYTDIFAASSADFNFGSGDFTIECFFNPSYVPASGDTTFSRLFDTGQLSCFFYSGNIYLRNAAVAELVTVVAHGLSAGVWYHLAIVRSGTTYYIFRNGSQLTSGTGGTITSASAPFVIGTNTSYNQPLDGFVSNFRVTTGQALYTSTFTPATTPLTTTSQSATASNVKLLTCQSNRFVDNSTQSTKTILLGDNSANPGTRFVQAFEPFAPGVAYSAATVGGSGYFDGTADFLTTPSDAAFSFGTSDFSEEFWIYLTTTPTTFQRPLQYSDDRDNIVVESGNFRFFDGTGTTISAATTGQWFHLCVTRVGGTLRGFVNGQLGFTRSGTYNSNTRSLALGATSGGSNPLGGYTSNYRIVKGGIPSAYSTSSTTVGAQIFTPPTAPFTGSESLTAGSVSLLLNFTNAGITDATAKNVLETVGNAQISTAQSKFGGSSMYFDGTGDYLSIPKRPYFDFPGDFTIEFWLYANSLASYGFLMDTRSSASTFWLMELNTSGVIGWGPDATIRISSSAISTGQWYHVAVARSGSSTKMFLNGTQTGSTYTSSATITAGTTNVVVGGSALNPGAFNVNCYIDDLRITVGYARYTANFTAPTAAFPLQ